jgi:hypothetical protein
MPTTVTDPPTDQGRKPCHTGVYALTCGFCRDLTEIEVDTAELLAATTPAYMCTCISCGAPWGQPHAPDCPQTIVEAA